MRAAGSGHRHPSVAVITITRSRPELAQCLASVRSQTYVGRIDHIIVVDGEESGFRVPVPPDTENRRTIVRMVDLDRRVDDFIGVYTPSRLALLRNEGLDIVEAEFVGYLDDDNTYDAEHVASLVATMRAAPDADVAYSWRRLQWPGGAPYLCQTYPWTPQARLSPDRHKLARYIYDDLVAGGVFDRGSAVVRDTLIDTQGRPVYTVDTNELFVRTSVHRQFDNIVSYTWREMVGDYSDDYAWVKRCHELGLQFRASERTTVNYTIGGTSNGSWAVCGEGGNADGPLEDGRPVVGCLHCGVPEALSGVQLG